MGSTTRKIAERMKRETQQRSETMLKLVNRLGRQNIIRALGQNSPSAISNAVRQGRFPASWYVVIETMCAEDESEGEKIELDRDLFDFKQDTGQRIKKALPEPQCSETAADPP